MTTPFRDDLAAALERATELEVENAELRVRVADLETTTTRRDAEVHDTFASHRGVMDRMKREHDDDQHAVEALRARCVELEKKLEALQAQPAQVKVRALESSNARWAVFTAFAFVIGASTRFC